jgi:hypothetical protein
MTTSVIQPRPRRRLVLGALVGLLVLLLSAALLRWAQDDGTRILGQADWPYELPNPAVGRGPFHVVSRSQGEFVGAVGLTRDVKGRYQSEYMLTKAFNAKAVDFRSQMVLLVSGGVQPTGGYRVEVTAISFDNEGKTMRVHWKLHPPLPDQPVTQRPNEPATIALLKRFDGEVRLEAPAGAEQESLGKTKDWDVDGGTLGREEKGSFIISKRRRRKRDIYHFKGYGNDECHLFLSCSAAGFASRVAPGVYGTQPDGTDREELAAD